MAEVLEIPAPGPSDPGGKRLAAVVNAQRRAEDWAARRVFYGRAVIVLSAAMAYILVRGTGLAGLGTRLVLALWLLSFAGLVGCAGAAFHAERRVEELLARAGGRRISTADSD